MIHWQLRYANLSSVSLENRVHKHAYPMITRWSMLNPCLLQTCLSRYFLKIACEQCAESVLSYLTDCLPDDSFHTQRRSSDQPYTWESPASSFAHLSSSVMHIHHCTPDLNLGLPCERHICFYLPFRLIKITNLGLSICRRY